MLNRILIPFIVTLLLIAVQFTLIPFIAVQHIIPNVVLIFVVIYTLKFGQISGMLFAFAIGFFFDIASAGIIGSGMFAFTLSAFLAGYFRKEEFLETLFNIKLFLTVIFFVSTIFFLTYTVLGVQEIEFEKDFSFVIYSILGGAYTTILSLVIFVIPKDKL